MFLVQSLSGVWVFVTPWTAAHQAPPSFISSEVCSNSCPLSDLRVNNLYFPYGNPTETIPLVEKLSFPDYLGTSDKHQLTTYIRIYFWTFSSALLITCLSLYQYHTFWITVALQRKLQSGRMSLSNLFFFHTAYAILRPLHFSIHFSVCLSISTK